MTAIDATGMKGTPMPHHISPPSRPARLAPALLGLAFALAIASGTGCDQDTGIPAGGTPVVSPDSDSARKAIAERDRVLEERKRQEAKALRRIARKSTAAGKIPAEE